MKKFIYMCILCGVLLTGCANKTDSSVTSGTEVIETLNTTVTTAESTETSVTTEDLQISDTTVSVIATDAVEVATTVSGEKKIESVKTTEGKAETTNPKVKEELPATKTTVATEAPKPKTTTTTTAKNDSGLSKSDMDEINQYVKKISQSYGIGIKCDECNNEGAVVLTGDIDPWDGYAWDTPTNTKISKTVDSIKDCVDSDIKRMYNEWLSNNETVEDIAGCFYISIYWEKTDDGYYNLYLMW